MKSGMMKRGIHKLDLWVDSSEKSSCVWRETLAACETAAASEPCLFEVYTSVPSLILSLTVLGSSVHLTAIS